MDFEESNTHSEKMNLFDAPLAHTVLSCKNINDIFDGKIHPAPIVVHGVQGSKGSENHGSDINANNSAALAELLKTCSLKNAGALMSKYLRVPLLFTQQEASRSICKEDSGTYVLRQARTHVSKVRSRKLECKKTPDGKKSIKDGEFFNQGIHNRGYVQTAPQYFFANSCDETEGKVLRSATVVSSAPVGFISNYTTQGLMHSESCGYRSEMGAGGVCFSNECACKTCGLVPTNLATCIFAARRNASTISCISNSLDELVNVYTAHEMRFREENNIDENAWVNCEQCAQNGQNIYYFENMHEAAKAFEQGIDVLREMHGDEALLHSLNAVVQHKFKDSINIEVDKRQAESQQMLQKEQGWISSNMFEQIGPLAEVVVGRSNKHSETAPEIVPKKRLRLLEPVRLEQYGADGILCTTRHDAGEIIEFPTDSATCGTRLAVLESIICPGGVQKMGLRRRTAAEVGELVRVSFHRRFAPVDEYRISKEKLAELRERGVLEKAHEVPQLIANLVVPTCVEEYKEWQQRSLCSYAQLEMLDVVTAPLPPHLQRIRSKIRQESAPSNPIVSRCIEEMHMRGAPGTAALPFVVLREIEEDLCENYYNALDRHWQLNKKDQSMQLHVIDRWIKDYRDKHELPGAIKGDEMPESQVLHNIYQKLTQQYLHGSGKFSDLDQFVPLMKVRMGVFTGIAQESPFMSGRQRREWRGLGIRGDTAKDKASRNLSAFVHSKFNRLKQSGPWR